MLRTSLLLFCLAPALLADPHKGVMLRENGFLTDGEYLTSANNRFYVIIEDGGNIVVHMGSEPHNDKGRMFSTNLGKGTGRHFMLVQRDGNFVIYRGTGPDHNGEHRWNIGHTGPGERFFAVMQDDGNFCMYAGTPADNRGHVWCTQSGRSSVEQMLKGWRLATGQDIATALGIFDGGSFIPLQRLLFNVRSDGARVYCVNCSKARDYEYRTPSDTFRGWRGELSLHKASKEDSAASICGNPLGIHNDPIPEGRGW